MDCIHENQDYSLYQFTMNLAHSVKNFLTPQTNVEFPVVCPFCSSTVVFELMYDSIIECSIR